MALISSTWQQVLKSSPQLRLLSQIPDSYIQQSTIHLQGDKFRSKLNSQLFHWPQVCSLCGFPISFSDNRILPVAQIIALEPLLIPLFLSHACQCIRKSCWFYLYDIFRIQPFLTTSSTTPWLCHPCLSPGLLPWPRNWSPWSYPCLPMSLLDTVARRSISK